MNRKREDRQVFTQICPRLMANVSCFLLSLSLCCRSEYQLSRRSLPFRSPLFTLASLSFFLFAPYWLLQTVTGY